MKEAICLYLELGEFLRFRPISGIWTRQVGQHAASSQ